MADERCQNQRRQDQQGDAGLQRTAAVPALVQPSRRPGLSRARRSTSDVFTDNIRCMRTTLDLDGSVLAQLKALQRRRNTSLGRLASELLAKALAEEEAAAPPAFAWNVQPMGARIDLEDRDALALLLDERA